MFVLLLFSFSTWFFFVYVFLFLVDFFYFVYLFCLCLNFSSRFSFFCFFFHTMFFWNALTSNQFDINIVVRLDIIIIIQNNIGNHKNLHKTRITTNNSCNKYKNTKKYKSKLFATGIYLFFSVTFDLN